MFNYHPLVSQIIKLITDNNYWYEQFEHQPVRTSQEAAKIRNGYTLSQGAKALIVRVKRSESDKNFVMLVVPGDKKFDNQKAKNILNAKDIRFATEQEVSDITHCVQVGGVPPFGNLFGLPVYVDNGVLANPKIIFNAGDRSFSIALNSADYLSLVHPIVASLV